MKKAVSLREVAKVAGVDVSTVSYALRNRGTVGQATRERIVKVAERLGYQPNPVIASLARGRFQTQNSVRIALAYLVAGNVEKSRQFGAEDQARKLGYNLQVMTTDQLAPHPHPDRLLHARGFGGIIFDGDAIPGKESWNWNLFAAVVMGSSGETSFLHRANSDHFARVRLAWKQARARGYRRIGGAIMRHEPIIEDDRMRIAAALLSVEETRQEDRIPLFIEELAKDSSGKFLDWLECHRPDCVIGFHVGFYHTIQSYGSRIPTDIGFISLHVGSHDNISGLMIDDAERGRAAVEMLDQEIRSRYLGIPVRPRTILLEPFWNEGRTLRRLP